MENFEQNPGFLKERFSKLAGSPEVGSAAKRTERKTDEVLPRNPEARIQNYLDRLTEIVGRKDPKEKKRGINALKEILIDEYVVRVEDIPESYWQAQMRVVYNRGELGDWQDISEDEKLKIKQKHLAQTKEDQKGSLEGWIDYLVSDKSSYLPDYLKYWAFQGMLQLERYEKGDKEQGISGRFPRRSSGKQRSVKMFPEVNERGLQFISRAYRAQSENQPISFRYDIPETARSEFQSLLKQKDFRSVYGWTQEHLPPISPEEMQTTEGEWTVYKQGSNPKALAKTLQGKGSGWCITGENLAGEYLAAGNLYIYYSKDRQGASTIPRVVIVQKNNRVTEVRGIEWEENVDAYIKGTGIIGDKLKEVSGGESFFETDQDTKQLTALDRKMSGGENLTKGELLFLYEINRPIKYFGYQKDPRIAELRKDRNKEADMSVIFECRPDQIAQGVSKINENTRAYLGEWNPTILKTVRNYPNITHLYESFPDKAIFLKTIETDPTIQSQKQAEAKLKEQSIYLSPYGNDLLNKTEFSTHRETYELVRFTVAQLGFPNGATTEQIYKKAEESGLDLCPAEVGTHLRLSYPGKEWMTVAMKQITGLDGFPSVFNLGRDGFMLKLDAYHAWPEDWWNADYQFVFLLRKKKL